MNNCVVLPALSLIALGVFVARADDSQATNDAVQPAVFSRGSDEKLLQKSAVDFTNAFNAHDAKAIAAQFAVYAELASDDVDAIQGREAIEAAFVARFKAQPNSRIAIDVESLRFLGDDLAIEDGRMALRATGDDEPVHSRYSAIHVREGDQWMVASTRETTILHKPTSAHEHLRQLEWMVGEWIDESPHAVVTTLCRWDESKNFILRDYSVKVDGQVAMSGTQRTGWDPLSRQLKAWSFDSEGGYGEGFWHSDGNRWTLRLHGVSADGRVGSAAQVHTFVSNHMMTWEATNRSVGGESLPDIEEIVIVRVAPKPL